ncbi:MAG: SigB/SigF/SigG family RNA polymerase sigma factor [Actinomycetota bacterium]
MSVVTTEAVPRGMRLGYEDLAALHEAYHRTGDPELRAALVKAHAPLAHSLAGRFAGRGEALDDLIQAAMLGLLHAIDRFDPGRGLSFTTFAWSTITGELKRHFRDRTWGLHVPRVLQERYLEVVAAVDELRHEVRRSPTIAEVAERVGLREEDVIEAMDAGGAHRLASLDAPTSDGRTAGATLGFDDDGMRHVEGRQLLAQLLPRLSERDRLILRLRFDDRLSQAEIGERIGLSQMQVSRLLAQSLARLRSWA